MPPAWSRASPRAARQPPRGSHHLPATTSSYLRAPRELPLHAAGPSEQLPWEAGAETTPGGDLLHPESAAGVLCPLTQRIQTHITLVPTGRLPASPFPTEQRVPPRCLHSPPTGNWDAGSTQSCPPAAPESRCSWLRQPSHQRQPLRREAGGRELFFQRPAGGSGPPAREMPTAGEGRGKDSSIGTARGWTRCSPICRASFPA